MDASRLGNGAVVAVVSALVVLLGSLVLDWYSPDQSIAPVQIERSFLAQLPGSAPQAPNDLTVELPANAGAWDGAGFLGTIANLIVLAAAVAALGIAYSQAREWPLPEGALKGLLLLSAAAVLMVLLRMIFPPEDHLSLEVGAWVTLLGSLGLLAGARMLRDEAAPPPRRRDTPPATS